MIFNLSKKLEYTKKGDFTETASLEFTAPGMAQYDVAMDLSQLIMGAILDAQKHAPKPTEEEKKVADVDVTFDREAVRVILLSSQSIKFKDIAAKFQRLACDIGTCDGEVKLTKELLAKLEVNDYTNLVCDYVVNFIAPSLFSMEGV